MKLLKKVTAALMVAVGASAATLAAAAPAQAAPGDCFDYDNVICLTEHGNWTGRVWRQLPGQIGFCRNLTDDNFNDIASAWVNRTKYRIHLYENIQCGGHGGQKWTFEPGEQWIAGPNTNDKVSSISYSSW